MCPLCPYTGNASDKSHKICVSLYSKEWNSSLSENTNLEISIPSLFTDDLERVSYCQLFVISNTLFIRAVLFYSLNNIYAIKKNIISMHTVLYTVKNSFGINSNFLSL